MQHTTRLLLGFVSVLFIGCSGAKNHASATPTSTIRVIGASDYTGKVPPFLHTPIPTPVSLAPCPADTAPQTRRSLAEYFAATPKRVYAYNGYAQGNTGDLYIDEIVSNSADQTVTAHRSLGVHGSYPLLNPDTTKVLYFTDTNDIAVVNTDGKNPHILLTDIRGTSYSSYTWSPNGQMIAYIAKNTTSQGLWVMQADGTNPRNIDQFATNPTISPNRLTGSYYWSSDSKYIADTVYRPSGDYVHVSLADTAETSAIYGSFGEDMQFVRWSGDQIVIRTDLQGQITYSVRDPKTQHETACFIGT